MTAGRNPDAPTDRAGDGHRQMAAEVLYPGLFAHDAIRLHQAQIERTATALAEAELRGYERGSAER